MSQLYAGVGSLALTALLLGAGARLILWSLNGEPGRRRPCSWTRCPVCQVPTAAPLALSSRSSSDDTGAAR
ncbi:hypothetical protein ACFQ6U_26925 [Streptomyces sp. NPDC056465]|uniref:hypothetical protein n=1 Tax=Streptomyces sp. NPDC056465 TaxID=3345829 RepID=UPI003679AAB4